MGQARARDVAVGRVFMVQRRQRRDVGKSKGGGAGGGLSQFGQLVLAPDGRLGQCVGGGVAVDDADGVLLQDADVAAVAGLN